ncbi:MAG: DUF402 domain-containing protein [Nitrospirota bacterium]|nr:DUF402 domain-containing protein [Nitrospirota bacterium]
MPICIERKHLLTGSVHTYQCELIHFEPGFGILKYVIDREYVIANHRLAPGDITCALYWEDRPYTLYIWKLADASVLHYFNIADHVSLAANEFIWRDLVIDILVDQGGTSHVLDANELPQELDKDLLTYIRTAQQHVLSTYPLIMEESRSLLQRHGC